MKMEIIVIYFRGVPVCVIVSSTVTIVAIWWLMCILMGLFTQATMTWDMTGWPGQATSSLPTN